MERCTVYHDLRANVYAFLQERLGISRSEAQEEYERLKNQFSGEVSIAVEKEYAIDRYEYFANTWNLRPDLYLKTDESLPELLANLQGRFALLTTAPSIWACNVLAFLQIDDLFAERIYTGEPDERKPNPIVLERIAREFNVLPERVISIGDQEESDILPAKSIGMKTVLIGSLQTTTADYQAENITLAIRLLQQEGLI